MVVPKLADVRPRVMSKGGEFLLEDLIESYLAEGRVGTVELLGHAGTGKSTALAHLAAQSYGEQLLLLDNRLRTPRYDGPRLVIYAARAGNYSAERNLQLAPWSRDDLIELLLARYPKQCGSILERISAENGLAMLEGSPRLVCAVAEQMAADENLPNVRAALRQAVAALCSRPRQLLRARRFAASQSLESVTLYGKARALRWIRKAAPRLMPLLREHPVRVLLTADQLVDQLSRHSIRAWRFNLLPRDVIEELGRLLAGDTANLERLQQAYDSSPTNQRASIGSVLFAADNNWRPNEQAISLRQGEFAGANWDGIQLQGSMLMRTNLNSARLRQANFHRAWLREAKLSGADLTQAKLTKVKATFADFRGAILTRADLVRADFNSANLRNADLCGVFAHRTSFYAAKLANANFREANLTENEFRTADLAGADFTGANLAAAILTGAVLRNAVFDDAILDNAELSECDLEFVTWQNVHFNSANLKGAYLTGSSLVGADLRHANLTGAGLADVDLQGADLRFADLRKCTFHMGSSRSGLVGSTYPCHGSKTGFYTDDFNDQNYQPPEVIRKANLCCADLRGARIDNVDFYLVDLRDARYDDDQARHFRACSAILENYQP